MGFPAVSQPKVLQDLIIKIQNFFKEKKNSHISHTRQMIPQKKRCSDLPPLNRSVFLNLAGGGVSESKSQEDQSGGN